MFALIIDLLPLEVEYRLQRIRKDKTQLVIQELSAIPSTLRDYGFKSKWRSLIHAFELKAHTHSFQLLHQQSHYNSLSLFLSVLSPQPVYHCQKSHTATNYTMHKLKVTDWHGSFDCLFCHRETEVGYYLKHIRDLKTCPCRGQFQFDVLRVTLLLEIEDSQNIFFFI